MGFLTGKRALIVGLLSDRSIAYGIAQAMQREGCELAFTYVGERFKDRVTELAHSVNGQCVAEMDMGDDASIERAFKAIRSH